MTSSLPTIIVVDDSVEVRLLVRTALRLSGRLTVVAEGSDGAEAVALATTHRPDLVLMDVSMPGMDGLEALPAVLEASPATRVALFSGFEEQGLADRALELGASTFIEKSTDPDDLPDLLLRLLATDGPHEHTVGRVDAAADPTDGADDARARDVLDEHLERFREVFEEAAIGMATMTLAGRIVRANRALGGLLRRDRQSLIGVDYAELTDGRGDLVASALHDVQDGGLDAVRLEHDVAGGDTPRQVLATFAPVRDSANRALYLFVQVQDVTAQRAAEIELRGSEERFRLLVEAVQDYAIFMLDPDGRIASWNAGAQRSKGYRADEIIGRHFREFYPPAQQESKHPEYELTRALADGSYSEEGWRVRKDGSRFWAHVVITAVFNDDGEHIGFAKVTRDTTERRLATQEREQAAVALREANAELEDLNKRLLRAAEDQSQFLAVTAHELRTPVAVLGGSADTLSRHATALTEDERAELLTGMVSSAGRLRRLLADLLTASRLEARALDLVLVPVAMADVISAAVASLHASDPSAAVVVEPADDLTVRADADRLAQAVENLLRNAVRHGRPPVRVATVADGATVQVRVTDDGGGVDPALAGRLFERFATGDRRSGTGLGLYIVRELARSHRGDASYEPPSEDTPSGAFVISLPRA
jgi:PAS domain S-box-containing protein